MQHSESIDKIMPALAAVHAAAGPIEKSQTNDTQHYTYANLEAYLNVVRPLLEEHGLFVVTSAPEIQPSTGRLTAKGTQQNGVYVRLVFTLHHTSGQWIEVEAWGEGQDSGDKAVYKATTGARKYGVAMLFGLVTTDDPEKDSHNGNGKPAKAGTPLPNTDDLL